MQENRVFDTIFSGLIQAESGGRHYGDDGNLLQGPVLPHHPDRAQGITQLMPDTMARPGFGVQPIQNDTEEEYIRFGRDYLGALLRTYNGDVRMALAAYNAGAGNVNRAVERSRVTGRDFLEHLPMPEQTVPYVEKIMRYVEENGGFEADIEADIDPEVVQDVMDGEVDPDDVEVEVEEQEPASLEEKFEQLVHDPDGKPRLVVDPETGEQFYSFPRPRQDIHYSEVREDPAWLDAAQLVYEMYHGRPPFREDFETDRDLADWGLWFMARMNFQIPTLAMLSNRIYTSGTLEQKMALAYMIEQQSEINMSWAGAGRGAAAMALDPTNYLSLTLALPGLLTKHAATVAAKQTLVQALKASVVSRTTGLLAVEGAIWAGAFDTLSQNVNIQVGLQEDRNYWQTTGMLAGGAVLAGATGTAIDLIGRRIAGRGLGNATTPGTPGVTPRPDDVAPDGFVGPMPSIQRGRRPEDDIIPEGRPASIRQLEEYGVPITNLSGSLRSTPRSIADAMQYAKVFSKSIQNVPREQIPLVAEGIRRLNLGPDSMADIQLGVRQAAHELNVQRASLIQDRRNVPVNSPEMKKIQKQLDELENLVIPLNMMDEAFGSMAGSTLRQRVGFGPRITVESVKREFPNKSAKEAEEIWEGAWRKWQADKAAQKVRDELNPEIDRLVDSGDWDAAVDLRVRREALIDALYDELPDMYKPISHHLKNGVHLDSKTNQFFRELAEVSTANVFGVKTLIINLIPSMLKTIMRPAIHSVLKNPLRRASYVEMVANYSAMSAGFRSALKMGQMSFKYEAMILSRDHMRFLDAELANAARVTPMGTKNPLRLIGQAAPGVLRMPLRLMSATDDFLSTMAHNGYVAGRAAAEAYADALSNGADHRAASRFAKKVAEKALENKATYRDLDERVNIITKKGINLGYRGDDLKRYVVENAKRDAKNMRKYKDEDVRSYLQDILFKTEFEPNPNAGWYHNSIEHIGGGIEQWFKNYPVLKYLTGQLFFRTPIRAVEEGFRLIPGLQLLFPRFLPDLMGKNGTRAQTRAMGEHLLGLGLVGHALMKYSEGDLQGSGLHNYRQRMLQQDSALADPYTIEFKDGKTWSFRMFDPIATPLKVVANAFERIDNVKMREAQGEYIRAGQAQKAMDYFTGTLLAVTLAIKDANLFSGLGQTMDLATFMSDESPTAVHDINPMVKWIGERIKWTLPATIHHLHKTMDPTIYDPKTVPQMLMLQTGPIGARANEMTDNWITTPRAYDYLGHTKSITDIHGLWSYLSTASIEEREKGRSPEAIEVMELLTGLGERTRAQFLPEYKHRHTGNLDMRMIETGNGDETLYDVWNKNYRALNPEQYLLPVLRSDLAEGTPSQRGEKIDQVQGIVRTLRDAAFFQMLADNQHLIDKIVQHQTHSAETKAGFWDAFRPQNAPGR